MKMTPLDIRQKRFERELRGYSKREVEGFLELTAAEFEEVVKENIALKEELKRVNARPEEYFYDGVHCHAVKRIMFHPTALRHVVAERRPPWAGRSVALAYGDADVESAAARRRGIDRDRLAHGRQESVPDADLGSQR